MSTVLETLIGTTVFLGLISFPFALAFSLGWIKQKIWGVGKTQSKFANGYYELHPIQEGFLIILVIVIIIGILFLGSLIGSSIL